VAGPPRRRQLDIYAKQVDETGTVDAGDPPVAGVIIRAAESEPGRGRSRCDSRCRATRWHAGIYNVVGGVCARSPAEINCGHMRSWDLHDDVGTVAGAGSTARLGSRATCTRARS
jgi:hypothetical protein